LSINQLYDNQFILLIMNKNENSGNVVV